MNDTKKNIELNAGWILCPSKSFPGKFYYFNVLNGETAWSLNQNDNKDIKKESVFHRITDKSHGYPEPKALPDEAITTTHNIHANFQRPNYLGNVLSAQLPTFGQAIFPKYVSNVEPIIPNIVWTSLPFPMFCPERKPMFEKATQISEFERELFAQSSNIPLCKRFKNYEPPSLSFDTKSKVVKPFQKFETSTPKNPFLECVSESQNLFSKSLIKEPTFKFESKIPTSKVPEVKSNVKPTISVSNKVESTKSSTEAPEVVQKDSVLENLDRTDLRFLLLAKRKSLDTTDVGVERKKLKPNELKPLTLKKKVTFDIKCETDDDTNTNYNAATQEDFIILTSNQSQPIDAPKSPTLLKDPPSFIKDSSKTPLFAKNELPTANNQRPSLTYKSTTWYIVVDTDVLLLDYELIDRIVLADPKCRLVIPYAVAADIEALCLGDCRGQQRVINARQLTRRLTQPPHHYIVEHRTPDNGNIVVTTESILQCCMKAVNKNYYVVLITNDPHLKIRATLQNIPSYKLNEIKYGVDISPPFTTEAKNINNNFLNDNTDTKNQFRHNLNLFSNLKIQPEVTSNMKKITPKNDENAQNFGLFGFRNPVKKQLFLSDDSETDSSVDDRIINITKPKNIKNLSKSDSDGTSDISSEVSSLKLKDKSVLKPKNVARNPFLSQNLEKLTQNPQSIFTSFDFGKTKKENPVLKPDNETQEFQKDTLEYNFETKEKVFCPVPITNITLFEPKTKPENAENLLSLTQTAFAPTRDTKTLSASQTRIKKIINTIATDLTAKNQDGGPVKTKDSTGIFKIPQLLPIKSVARNTSVQLEGTTVNDKIGTRTSIDPIDENLSRFYIKSKNMRQKIETRIDEWICSYMQIMEDALVNVLQKNSVCMKNTVAPLNFKDTLNCIKMLYGCHTKIRDIINKLSELLEKCMICAQGKLKLDIAPEDFMKVFGYGVLLILSLKIILPLNEEIKEAEFRLNVLQRNLESNVIELDPELVKSPSVSRSDIEKDQQEMKPPFLKKRSYVTDYLKKHFDEWATYEEDLEDQNSHKIEDHTDFKVVRTCGKNLSLLKLDRSKTMSLSKNTNEDNSANRSKNGPKLIRLLENNQINKPDTTEIIKENNIKLMEVSNKDNNSDFFSGENELMTENEKDVPLKKLIENIEQDNKIESTKKDDLNYTPHENTFIDKNEEKNGPKIVRNIKLIEEFEQKFKKTEPLDLDLLDYSEIYEPSVNENLDFDIYSEKNKTTEVTTKFEDSNNFGLTNTMSVLEDFFITPSVSPDSRINNNDTQISENTVTSVNSNCSENSDHFISVSEYNKISHIEVKAEKDTYEESETFTEKQDSSGNEIFEIPIENSETYKVNSETRIGNSETRIGKSETRIGNSETRIGNSETRIGKSETRLDNSETRMDTCKAPNYDSGTILDNSEMNNFDKTAEIVQDGSTNDSGFENDSTYAHSTIKIFLHELVTTFKEIHTFVIKFVNEILETNISSQRKDVLHYRATKALEDMVAIIQQLKSIIKRESQDDTVLKRLLRNAGVEATTDKRMMRYRQIVIKCMEQGLILESALKIIVSTTIGDYEALSTNAETLNSSIRYFNIFE